MCDSNLLESFKVKVKAMEEVLKKCYLHHDVWCATAYRKDDRCDCFAGKHNERIDEVLKIEVY